MKTTSVSNKTFSSAIIDMDNKRFVGCKFEHCALRYAGGKCEWDKNTIFDGCAWEPSGKSQNIKKVLDTFGIGLFTLRNIPFSI
jgi:hypothetical protein